MAGWSIRADGFSLEDCAETVEKLGPASPFVDLEPFSEGLFLKPEPDKLRFWFSKFLGLFLKEICAQGCLWPLPPLLADGQPVDLFKLFLVVRENGGYNAVSESGLWDLVARDSGFDLNVASSLNLVYVKYLVSLDRWLESIIQSEDSQIESNCSSHLMELGTELNEFLLQSRKNVMKYSQVEESVVAGSNTGEKCVKSEESIHIDFTKRSLRYEEVENLQNGYDLEGNKKFIYVDDYEVMPTDMAKSAVNSMPNEDEDCIECKNCTDSNDGDVMILDSNEFKENISSCKRRRDSSWEMLNWVTEVAKDPCDSAVGSLPEVSRWKAYGSEQLWKQVLLFREASFRRKNDYSSAGQFNLQKNQKMHPSMYDDNSKFGYNLRERLSCTKKVPFGRMASKGQDWSNSSSSLHHSELDSSMLGIDKQLCGDFDSATPGSVFDYDVDIQVPVGPLFQVELPELTRVVSESDAKWLGTRIWPLEKSEKRSLIEMDRIGKGGPDSCGCRIQDSVQCVKFHVGEKRLKAKLELGSAFKKWKFDKMGEDVAFGWAEEEQKKFSSIVNSNPSSDNKCFWDEIYKYFSKKSREELVCYYYNVFLLQRRAYQNRVTPSNINSDDEEPEAESTVKGGGGREATKSYTSILISPKKSQKRSR